MRRSIFYGLMVFQAIVLLLVAVQFNFVEDYGKTVSLLSEESMDGNYYATDMHFLDLEINHLSETIWNIDEELNYQEKLYVLLEPDSHGIYHAVYARLDKPETQGDQIVLRAHFDYYDSTAKEYHVRYGIEWQNQVTKAASLDSREQWVIDIKVAPWGQLAVTEITER